MSLLNGKLDVSFGKTIPLAPQPVIVALPTVTLPSRPCSAGIALEQEAARVEAPSWIHHGRGGGMREMGAEVVETGRERGNVVL